MIDIIFFVCVALMPAIVLHEYAHGWAANRLGDPTARLLGRLTLNPIKHIDPIGSILVPGFLYMASQAAGVSPMILGWAKPVPVNFSRLAHPRRDMVLVAIAGPVVNIILAFVFVQFFRFEGPWQPIIVRAFLLNLVLAVFNMVPVPPLDGSRVLSAVLPARLAYQYNRLEPWGFLIVLLALNFGLFDFIYPIVGLLAALMGASL